MPSLLPGYEYDVFISYRQNDNRQGWVTEFVKALQEELAATIKDSVSIYFDSNPHDGLLETHNVDKSLEGKLKCLIFVPILSQTYCDPKSFAWQNELCAFNKASKEDPIGRDIKLSNGNVASRILPVKIHDLDSDDRAILELEIGGAIRGIEFIYREAGVNRPLKPSDDKHENQNKTDYQNQVNKVANAVKDLINSLRRPHAIAPAHQKAQPSAGYHVPWRRIAILVILLLGSYFTYKFYTQPSQATEHSVAVLPFVDMTSDADMEYLCDGLADEIINSLTTIQELKVAGRTSSFQFKGEKVDVRTIGEQLKVRYVLEGSVQKYEDNFRITAQLIRTDDNFHAWSQRFDLEEVNIFRIQDIIAAAVVEKLRLTLTTTEREHLTKKVTSSEAYSEYLKGLHHWKANGLRQAQPHFERSVQLDSTYAPSLAYLAMCKASQISNYHRPPHPDSTAHALSLARRAIRLDPGLPEGYSAVARISWQNQRDFAKAKTYFEKSIELNPSSSLTRNRYAYFLTWMGDFAKASQMNRAALALDPLDWNSYTLLFDSAYYNNDPVAASRWLAEYQQTFGRDGRWLLNSLQLDELRKDHRRIIFRYDSLLKVRKDLGPAALCTMARSYINLGSPKQADSLLTIVLREKKPNSYFPAALVLAAQNKLDSCFKYLRLACEGYEGQAITLKIAPELRHLHNDPRYVKLYKEMGFDKY